MIQESVPAGGKDMSEAGPDPVRVLMDEASTRGAGGVKRTPIAKLLEGRLTKHAGLTRLALTPSRLPRWTRSTAWEPHA